MFAFCITSPSHSRRIPFRAAAAHALLASLVLSTPAGSFEVDATAPSKPLLFQQEAFDEITLDAANGSEVVKVLPLDLPDRRVPAPAARTGALTVRPLVRPMTPYEVSWSAIAQVRLFEDLVLAEAEQLARDGDFDDAYRAYDFLVKNYPNVRNLDDSIATFLYRQMAASYKAERYDDALSVGLELARRSPTSARVRKAFDRVADKLIVRYMREGNESAAQSILTAALAIVGDSAETAARRWRNKFQKEASQALTQAREAFAAGAYDRAAQASAEALRIWPALAGGRELARQIHEVFPQITVGVTAPAGELGSPRLDDCPSRRSSRLVYRTVMELADSSSEGVQYRCPLGRLQREESGVRLDFSLRADSARPAAVTGYDLAAQLLAMASPAAADYCPPWSEVVRSIRVPDVFSVSVLLRRRHLRPEALLRVPCRRAWQDPESGAEPAATGPYRIADRSASLSRYVANEDRLEPGSLPTKQIVERWLGDGRTAIRSLRQGQVDVLDRVPPWEVAALSKSPDITVSAYALPTIHVLLPNRSRPLMASRTFRRALVYGIHRRAIVEEILLAGSTRPGFVALSGPFPAGVSLDDPLGYATDRQIRPRPFEPRLCVILASAAWQELAVDSGPAGSPAGQAAPDTGRATEPNTGLILPRPLVLAHPPEPVARSCCRAIQQHLQLAKIPVELLELSATAATGPDAQFDLRYAELAVWEPVVDAETLLGDGGLTGTCSAYMGQALRQLRRAGNWNEARQRLRRIHQIARDEVAVIPLWQTVNYFAYRNNVRGIGARPVTLYQNVASWRVERNGN